MENQMINTAGYDIVVQLHEKMLNKALAMAFYAGLLNVPEATYPIMDKDKAGKFAPFNEIKYEIKLTGEPFIDLTSKKELFVRCGSELRLNLFNCADIFFTLEFRLKAKVDLDLKREIFDFTIISAEVLNIIAQREFYVDQKFLNALNYIISEVLNKYFKNKQIDISSINNFKLSELKSKYSLKQCDIEVFDNKSIVAGLSLYQEQGSISKFKSQVGGSDCFLAVDENAARNLFDSWWQTKNGSINIDFDKTANINFASGVISKTTDTVLRVVTLGFIETQTDFENMLLYCKGTIAVQGTPSLNFTEGGTVEIMNLDVVADVSLKIEASQTQSVSLDKSSFIPDSLTKFEDDVHLSTTKDEHKVLLDTKNTFTLKLEKAGARLKFKDIPVEESGKLIDASLDTIGSDGIEVVLDGSDRVDDGSIVAKVTDAEFKVDFDKKGASFSDATWQKLMDLVKGYVIDKIPEFTVSPSLILRNVKVLDKYTMTLSKAKLDIADNGFAMSLDVNANEVSPACIVPPTYIADGKKKVIHRFDCGKVHDIRQENREGWFIMYEALAKGYTACEQCLKGYKKIQ